MSDRNALTPTLRHFASYGTRRTDGTRERRRSVNTTIWRITQAASKETPRAIPPEKETGARRRSPRVEGAIAAT